MYDGRSSRASRSQIGAAAPQRGPGLIRASSVDQANKGQMATSRAEIADFSTDRRAALDVQRRGLDAKNVGFSAAVGGRVGTDRGGGWWQMPSNSTGPQSSGWCSPVRLLLRLSFQSGPRSGGQDGANIGPGWFRAGILPEVWAGCAGIGQAVKLRQLDGPGISERGRFPFHKWAAWKIKKKISHTLHLLHSAIPILRNFPKKNQKSGVVARIEKPKPICGARGENPVLAQGIR